MAMNAEQLTAYERDGVVVPIDAMSAGEALALRREIEAIETTHGGRLAVADTGNDRIQAFDARGELLWSFGRSGERPGEFRRPMDVDVDDPPSTLWVIGSDEAGWCRWSGPSDGLQARWPERSREEDEGIDPTSRPR